MRLLTGSVVRVSSGFLYVYLLIQSDRKDFIQEADSFGDSRAIVTVYEEQEMVEAFGVHPHPTNHSTSEQLF